MRIILAALFALAALVLLPVAGPAEAASECKSLESKTSCGRRDDCVWVDSYKTSKGTKVSAYCRAKGGKSAKKSSTKTTEKKATKETAKKTTTKASDTKKVTTSKAKAKPKTDAKKPAKKTSSNTKTEPKKTVKKAKSKAKAKTTKTK